MHTVRHGHQQFKRRSPNPSLATVSLSEKDSALHPNVVAPFFDETEQWSFLFS